MDTQTHIQRLGERARHRAAINRARDVLKSLDGSVLSRAQEDERIRIYLAEHREEFTRVSTVIAQSDRAEERLHLKTEEERDIDTKLRNKKDELDRLIIKAEKSREKIEDDLVSERNILEQSLSSLRSEVSTYSVHLKDLQTEERSATEQVGDTQKLLDSVTKALDLARKNFDNVDRATSEKLHHADEQLGMVASQMASLEEREKRLLIYNTRLEMWARILNVQLPNV